VLTDALWSLRTAANEYRKNDVLSSTKHVYAPIFRLPDKERNKKKDTVPEGTTSRIFYRITGSNTLPEKGSTGIKQKKNPIWLRPY